VSVDLSVTVISAPGMHSLAPTIVPAFQTHPSAHVQKHRKALQSAEKYTEKHTECTECFKSNTSSKRTPFIHSGCGNVLYSSATHIRSCVTHTIELSFYCIVSRCSCIRALTCSFVSISPCHATGYGCAPLYRVRNLGGASGMSAAES